jgi:hypothetical protein
MFVPDSMSVSLTPKSMLKPVQHGGWPKCGSGTTPSPPLHNQPQNIYRLGIDKMEQNKYTIPNPTGESGSHQRRPFEAPARDDPFAKILGCGLAAVLGGAEWRVLRKRQG